MLSIFAYIINLLAPVVNTLGAIGLCGCVVYEDLHILFIAGILAVVGFIFGIFAHRMDIPPRWFWSKSRNELFSFSVTAVLGYAWSFAMWPCAIYLIMVLIEKVSMV